MQSVRDNGRGRKYRGAVLVGVLCFSSIAEAQISLVNVTSCGPGAFPGTTCTIPATGGGHLLVVGWQIAGSATTSTTISGISDNAGNPYVEAGAARAIDSAAGTLVDIWYAKNIVAGATAVTITPSVSVARAGVVIWEFSGASLTAPLDAVAVLNSQAATTTPSGASVTTSAANDVIVSIAEVANSVSGISSGNSFVSDSSIMSNGWAHLIASSAGAYSAQWNQSSSGTYASSTAAFIAASSGTGSGGGTGTGSFSPCDLNQDGVVNSTDVTLAVNMALGTTACTAGLEGPSMCTVVTVQRIINASEGQVCITYNTHASALTWVSSSSLNVAGYNVYRGTISGGPYTKVNSSLITTGTSFTDNSVQAGLTYYYVVTTVDTSGNESGYSSPVTATIPNP